MLPGTVPTVAPNMLAFPGRSATRLLPMVEVPRPGSHVQLYKTLRVSPDVDRNDACHHPRPTTDTGVDHEQVHRRRVASGNHTGAGRHRLGVRRVACRSCSVRRRGTLRLRGATRARRRDEYGRRCGAARLASQDETLHRLSVFEPGVRRVHAGRLVLRSTDRLPRAMGQGRAASRLPGDRGAAVRSHRGDRPRGRQRLFRHDDGAGRGDGARLARRARRDGRQRAVQIGPDGRGDPRQRRRLHLHRPNLRQRQPRVLSGRA